MANIHENNARISVVAMSARQLWLFRLAIQCSGRERRGGKKERKKKKKKKKSRKQEVAKNRYTAGA